MLAHLFDFVNNIYLYLNKFSVRSISFYKTNKEQTAPLQSALFVFLPSNASIFSAITSAVLEVGAAEKVPK